MGMTAFLERKKREIDGHLIITNNGYTKWFKQGYANTNDVIDLVEQFSVFSNHFLIAQCMRMVNASTEEAMEAARDILANEIGVGIDIKSGSTEGKVFSHKKAHIKWLRDIGEMLGIDRCKLGRWDIATPATRQFLEELEEVYGSANGNVGAGASFAIEYWAGFGLGGSEEEKNNNFWMELIHGLESYNKYYRTSLNYPALNLNFFIFHSSLEEAHVANVEHELEEEFSNSDFDEADWFFGARKALDAIEIFWKGLNKTRMTLF